MHKCVLLRMDIPIDVLLKSDALSGDGDVDHIHGGQVQTLQLLHCLGQEDVTAGGRDVHTAQVDQITGCTCHR